MATLWSCITYPMVKLFELISSQEIENFLGFNYIGGLVTMILICIVIKNLVPKVTIVNPQSPISVYPRYKDMGSKVAVKDNIDR